MANHAGGAVSQPMRRLEPYASSLAFFGARLREWRVRQELSLHDLGQLVHVSRDLIGKVEKAQRRPSPALIEALDVALNAGGDLEALAGTIHSQDRDDFPQSLERRPDLDQGSYVGWELIAGLRGVLDGLRRMDHSLGSGVVLTSVMAQAKMAEGLLPVSGGRVRVGLLGALAEIHQLAGWIRFDQGQPGTADVSFALAREFAEAANDHVLLAFILGPSQGFAATYSGNPDLGLRFCEAAADHAVLSGNARLTSFVLTMQARALARLHETSRCLKRLDEAADLLASHEQDADDPGWLDVFDLAALRGHRGSCLLDLGRPGEAIGPLSEQDAAADAVFVRNRTIWLLDTADARIALGEPEAACLAVEQAWHAAAGTSSARVGRRMASTAASLGRWQQVPEVASVQQLVGVQRGTRA